jgi:hypothetical protein
MAGATGKAADQDSAIRMHGRASLAGSFFLSRYRRA